MIDTTQRGDQNRRDNSLIKVNNRRDFSGRQTYTDYNGNHNHYNGGDRRHGGGVGIGSTHRSLGDIVLRGEHVHYADDFRHGYWQYQNGWHDSCFHFGFYFFDPVDEQCVVSPWYYYPMLPGYVSCRHIFYEVGPRCRWNDWGASFVYTPSIIYTPGGYANDGYGYTGGGYGYSNDSANNSSNPDLNHAIDEIVNSFQTGDAHALDDVMPKGLSVGIYIDGQYAYNVSSDDYYKMMQDNVGGVKTVSFHITDVRVDGNEAQVSAVHEYETPWGSTATVYQHYKLQRDREGYFITDFMTSHTP